MSRFFRRLFDACIAPRSDNEDRAREEFIVNILLVGSIGLSGIALVINIMKVVTGATVSIPVVMIAFSTALFVGLYVLSRRGHVRLSSLLLLTTFFLFTAYMSIKWGVDLPTGILTYALIIIMSGILLGSRMAFVATMIVGSTMALIQLMQQGQMISVNRYWRSLSWELTDTIFAAVLFGIIAIVSWLSNREIERSLLRARASEAALMRERDQLEVTVAQRTREIQEIQAEKMAQLYRFAEFGRLSSGLFHDLMNPLNALSLHMERLQGSGEEAETVNRAVRAAKKLQNLVASIRKQLVREESRSVFSVKEEIAYVMDVLAHAALKARVELEYVEEANPRLFGEAVRFNQIMLNLVANGIEACKHGGRVTMTVSEVGSRAQIIVQDTGSGIPPDILPKIFEPFFTTKIEGHGIGLSTSKRMLEKDFHGTITVTSSPHEGTRFTITIPTYT